MSANLLKFLSNDREARLIVADVTAPLRTSRMGEVETETARKLYSKIYTNCALLQGLLTDEQRLSVTFRFRGEGHVVYAEVDGAGHVHCAFSTRMCTFEGDPIELFGQGATLSITRGSWTGGMFTGTVELVRPGIDEAFSYFYRQSEQLETFFFTWTDGDPVRGCMIQPLPFARQGSVKRLMSQVLQEAARLRQAQWDEVEAVLSPIARVVERVVVHTHCQCSKEVLWGMLMAVDLEQLESALWEESAIEMECGLCGRKYLYDRGDLERAVLLKQRMSGG